MNNVIESAGVFICTVSFLVCTVWLGWSLLRRLFTNRDVRIAYLEEDYRRAFERGDIAAADQIEAELWDLGAAPGWPGAGRTGFDQRS